MEPEGDYSSNRPLKAWCASKSNPRTLLLARPTSPRAAHSGGRLDSPNSPKQHHHHHDHDDEQSFNAGDDNGDDNDDYEDYKDDAPEQEQETNDHHDSIVISDEPFPMESSAIVAQRIQEQRDYELARRLMDELPTSPITSPPSPGPATITGMAVAFVHAIRESLEQQQQDQQDPEMQMVSMVNGAIIHSTTERLLKFQQKIMQRVDHMIQRATQYHIQYNSDDDEHEDDEDRPVRPRIDKGPANQQLLLDAAAAEAKTGEHIDICYAASDETGTIAKLPSPASFGKGIYTSNTPFSPIFFVEDHKRSKRKLLLVARIKGKVEYIHDTTRWPSINTNSIKRQADSAIIVTPGTADQICILRHISQCVPLLVICPPEPGSGRPVLDYDDDQAVGNDIIHRYMCQLQRLVDQMLHHKDRHTVFSIPQRVLPSEVRGSASPASEISSYQLANSRALPRSMKDWTLQTVVYYSGPETIAENAFCFPSKEKLLQYLTHELPAVGSIHNSNKKCTICNKRENVMTTPACYNNHPFHIQCLLKRWCQGNNNNDSPFCDVLPLQYRRTAAISSADKDPAVILNFRIGDGSLSLGDEPKNSKSAHCHCHAPTSVLTVHVPIFDDTIAPMAAHNALIIRYDCGSTFQLKLGAPPLKRTTRTAEQWDLNFNDSQFLLQLQHRVKAHNAKCAACQQRVEGRRRSNILRYLVPNHSSAAAAMTTTPAATTAGNHNNSKDADNAKIFIGTMPSGTMRVDHSRITCSGHSNGTFVVTYRFDAGVQKIYHDHPRAAYRETYRKAYLPSSPAGLELLERLIIAFTYGLTFCVDRIVTTTGLVAGAIQFTIPHKTSISPGQFGYPDATYFPAAHAELDALGVPRVVSGQP